MDCDVSGCRPRRRIRRVHCSAVAAARHPLRRRRSRGMIVALIVLVLAFLPMAFEAGLAARPDRALRAAGASEPKDDVFPLMQVVYPTAFLVMALEAFLRGARADAVFAAGAVMFAAAKTVKYW